MLGFPDGIIDLRLDSTELTESQTKFTATTDNSTSLVNMMMMITVAETFINYSSVAVEPTWGSRLMFIFFFLARVMTSRLAIE